MSTNNHTAISTGAAANASTINTPLGAIDAAIGNLTTLTTTPKTSVVGALGTTALGTTATTISGAIAEIADKVSFQSTSGAVTTFSGVVDATGLRIGGVDVGTSTDTYWNAGTDGIDYGSFVGIGVAGAYTRAATLHVAPTMTDIFSGWHAFSDWSILNVGPAAPLGYAAFDAKPTLTNTTAMDHLIGFQSRPIYNGSAGMTDFEPFRSFGEHSGSGTITNFYGMRILDAWGAGPITNAYGLYIHGIARGANNYALVTKQGDVNFERSLLTQTTAYGKTDTAARTFAILGQSSDATNYSALTMYMHGGATAADRTWVFQTIEQGVANAGTINLQKSGGGVSIGTALVARSRLDISDGAMQFSEMAAPAAPAANNVVLYCVDVGGKTALYAIFPTGAAQQIALEP